jgi:hypothetical protein
MIPKEVLQHACDFRSLKQAEHYLNRLGYITFGIEYISIDDREIAYINLGDTYDCTIIREGSDYFTGSWGDWVEEVESENETD